MNIKNIYFLLNKANYHYNPDPNNRRVTLNIEDKVSIDEISDKKIMMIVSRKLFSSNTENLLVEVEFCVNFETTSSFSVQELEDSIHMGTPLLSNVFSRISVVISSMTNYSIWGPIVTKPDYDKDKIIIENSK